MKNLDTVNALKIKFNNYKKFLKEEDLAKLLNEI